MTANDYFVDGPSGRISVRAKGFDAKPKNVVVMVQGSNLTGQSMFDLTFPGGDGYSLMDVLVEAGYGAITFAVRGYGASELKDDPFSVTTETAMEDLEAVIDHVIGLGWTRPHLLGFSWGGRIGGRLVEKQPGKVDRMVLYDVARGGGNLVLPAPTEPWWDNLPSFYLEKFEPQFTTIALREALSAHVLANDPRAPNGIRLENASYTTPIDPEKVTRPTLLVYGVDGAKAIYMTGGMDRGEFFEKLATDDKAFVILPGGGDFIHFQAGRWRLHRAIINFLNEEG